jgi:hypothetical protein
MLNSIYISVPITTDWDTVLEYSRKLKIAGYQVNVWYRNERYCQSVFDKSDAVLFILPSNKFSASGSDLPTGLKKELSIAYNQHKKMFVGYKTSAGEFNIYDAETNGIFINAISGTANNIFKRDLNSFYGSFGNPCAEIGPIGLQGPIGDPGTPGFNEIDYDERLLLM